MPQPLRRWVDDITFRSEALSERPELAACIARVASSWARIEVMLGFLLGEMLGTEARTGVRMYLALTGSSAQDASLSAAAEFCLSADLQEEFTSLRREVRSCARQRNTIVHGIWGVTPKLPTSLVYCPPNSLIQGIADAAQPNGTPQPEALSRSFMTDLLEYREKDFLNVIARLDATCEAIGKFTYKVGLKRQPTSQPMP
jgi:hypothetical protein